MKKFISALFILLTISQITMAKWHNALAPAGKGKTVVLVKDGKANYKIIDNGNPEAAKFLRKGLKVVTGIDFTGDAQHSISFKKNKADLGIDGYAIEVKNGNIILSGACDNGIFNAATALLEEDLGWRYYQKYQKAVSPGAKITKADIVPRSYIPQFFQRCVYSKWAFDPAWAKANKIRKGNFGKYFVHTFFRLIPPSEFAKTNPQFYALRKGERNTTVKLGQLCMTNTELRHIMAQRVIKVLKANPGMDFIAVSQNDNDGCCQCPECAALTKKEGAASGPLLHFVNAVAAEVAEVYPRITIVTEAYRYSLLPPAKVKPAKNVVVRLCLNNRISSYPFFFVSETGDMKVLNDWSGKTDRLMIWDYMADFRHYLMPRADLPVLEKNIRLYRDKKVSGVMMQTNYHNEIGTQAAMRAWICAKLLWNPSLDANKLAEDYINGFWGKAVAQWMLKYNTLLIKEWRQFHANNKPGTSFRFSKDFYKTAAALLEKAMTAARNEPQLLRRLKIEELTLDYYRLTKGVTQESDIPAYRHVLDSFTGKLKKYNIPYIGEHISAKSEIAKFEDGIRLSKYALTVPADHIILPATWNVYSRKGLIADNNSLVGRTVKQEANGRWSVQWRFEDFPKLVPGKYKVRIRARADKKTSGGHGTIVGIYNRAKSTYALKYSVKGTQLDDKKFIWFDCCSAEISAEPMFLYTATAKNSAFKAFYIDAIEFIPTR